MRHLTLVLVAAALVLGTNHARASDISQPANSERSSSGLPGEDGPDLSLCLIQQLQSWPSVGEIKAYSLGTTAVNVGDQHLNWITIGDDHPVLSQNMFRYLDGRFEHIGQSWLKHHFCALQLGSTCATGCEGDGGCLQLLQPGCQSPSSASSNGIQSNLGPKWQVNAHAGQFSWPFDAQGVTGNSIFKRLQVKHSDLALPGAQYFVEGQYVAVDDASAGHQENNASYRRISVGPAPDYDISFVAGEDTVFQASAIQAWPVLEAGAQVDIVSIPEVGGGTGAVFVGYHATDNGDGTWHYEYAIQNSESDRGIGSFSVPLDRGVAVSNVGFHDVDYHSGEPFDNTDWIETISDESVTWSSPQTHGENPDSNALRWGTLYNFRFDADRPPTNATATLGLFKPGDPPFATVTVPAPGPLNVCVGDINGDGVVGPADLALLLAAWGPCGECDDCSSDLNADCGTDPADLATLLGGWGSCL